MTDGHPTAGTGSGSAFRSLRSRNYRLWFVGQAVSMTGYFVQGVALALLVLDLTDSGSRLGLVTLAQFLPTLILGPYAGVLCDRVDKRRILLITQAALMTSAFVLGILTVTGVVTFGIVLLFATISGVATGFDQAPRRGIPVELVDPQDVANAVSLNGLTANTAKIVGPAVAGVVVAIVGPGWCFMINGLTFLAVLIALLRMDVSAIRRPPAVGRSKGQIREGFRYVWGEPAIRWALLLMTAVAVMSYNWHILMPLLVTRDFGGSAGTLGLLMTTMSVGAIASSVWLARRGPVDMRFLGLCAVTLGVGNLLVASSPGLAAAAVFAMVSGAGSVMLFNAGLVLIQLTSVPVMRGRVMGMFGMIFLGSLAIGGPLSGSLAEQLGARGAIAIGGVLAIVAGTVVPLAARGRTVPRATAIETAQPVVADAV